MTTLRTIVRQSANRSTTAVAFALIAALACGCGTSASTTGPAQPVAGAGSEAGQSLYDRLGGADGVAALMEAFVTHVGGNKVIANNPHIMTARNRVLVPGLRFALTQFMCMKSGGPQKYTGRKLVVAHEHMRISETDWASVFANMESAVADRQLGEAEGRDVMAIVNEIKADIAGLTPTGPVTTHADGHTGQSDSLYERLGRAYVIATVADDFVDRLGVNPVLNGNAKLQKARAGMTSAGLKYRMAEYVAAATGGPMDYTGADVGGELGALGIDAEQWQAARTDLVAAMDKFQVPAAEQVEVLALVDGLKAQIVAVR